MLYQCLQFPHISAVMATMMTMMMIMTMMRWRWWWPVCQLLQFHQVAVQFVALPLQSRLFHNLPSYLCSSWCWAFLEEVFHHDCATGAVAQLVSEKVVVKFQHQPQGRGFRYIDKPYRAGAYAQIISEKVVVKSQHHTPRPRFTGLSSQSYDQSWLTALCVVLQEIGDWCVVCQPWPRSKQPPPQHLWVPKPPHHLCTQHSAGLV